MYHAECSFRTDETRRVPSELLDCELGKAWQNLASVSLLVQSIREFRRIPAGNFLAVSFLEGAAAEVSKVAMKPELASAVGALCYASTLSGTTKSTPTTCSRLGLHPLNN